MRILFTIVLFSSLLAFNHAADTTIVFKSGNYAEALEMAKSEKKPIFLYFHFDGCGACRKMEKTAFKDEAVFTFYNENFICFEINTLKGEGIEINKIYEVKMHPTFMYLDVDQNIVHKVVGLFSPEEFILEAKYALDPTKNLSAFKKKYEKGNRDANFLLDYCYKLNKAFTLDSFMINEYLNTQSLKDLEKEENIRFIYEFVIHQHKITMPIGSPAFSFLTNKQKLFGNYFDSEQVIVRILFGLNNSIYDAIETGDIEKFNITLGLLEGFDTNKSYYFKEMDGRTTGYMTGYGKEKYKIAFYRKNGPQSTHVEVLNNYIKNIWHNSDELNELAWIYFEESSDPKILEMAEQWVIRSIDLSSNYANNDTYAALLYKLEKYSKALIQAEKAISIATKNGSDHTETSKLMSKIKEKLQD